MKRGEDPLSRFLDRFGVANTSGARHAERRALLAEARAQIESEDEAFRNLAAELEMANAYLADLRSGKQVLD